jgi:hypothetical protein
VSILCEACKMELNDYWRLLGHCRFEVRNVDCRGSMQAMTGHRTCRLTLRSSKHHSYLGVIDQAQNHSIKLLLSLSLQVQNKNPLQLLHDKLESVVLSSLLEFSTCYNTFQSKLVFGFSKVCILEETEDVHVILGHVWMRTQRD